MTDTASTPRPTATETGTPESKYHYVRGTDGCDKTFDVYYGDDYIVSTHYWEEETWAEGIARLIVDALNAYNHAAPEKPASVW